MKTSHILNFIRTTFGDANGFIPLHAPFFGGREKEYVADTIDSTFVSSVGAYVNRFEEMMAKITGARYAIATVNGTTALHLGLIIAGVKYGDEVITQPLTFVATANGISHAGGIPVFVDVDKDTMGLSPAALQAFLEANAVVDEKGQCINKTTGRRIAACLPMHVFGFPVRIKEIATICAAYNIPLVEDAAESLGSYVDGVHTGTFGAVGIFSFNGNKTVTCGGGGAIITNDEVLARKAKHLSTTAKVPHPYEFVHDDIAFNYRMPNINAALACAQLEQLDSMLQNKRELAALYADFFKGSSVTFVAERSGTHVNYWLNTVLFADRDEQQAFLKESNDSQVMTRPIWRLMNRLPMYAACQHGDLTNAQWLEDRVVNIPSSVRKLS